MSLFFYFTSFGVVAVRLGSSVVMVTGGMTAGSELCLASRKVVLRRVYVRFDFPLQLLLVAAMVSACGLVDPPFPF